MYVKFDIKIWTLSAYRLSHRIPFGGHDDTTTTRSGSKSLWWNQTPDWWQQHSAIWAGYSQPGFHDIERGYRCFCSDRPCQSRRDGEFLRLAAAMTDKHLWLVSVIFNWCHHIVLSCADLLPCWQGQDWRQRCQTWLFLCWLDCHDVCCRHRYRAVVLWCARACLL